MERRVSPVTPGGTPGSPRAKLADFEITALRLTIFCLRRSLGHDHARLPGLGDADGATDGVCRRRATEAADTVTLPTRMPASVAQASHCRALSGCEVRHHIDCRLGTVADQQTDLGADTPLAFPAGFVNIPGPAARPAN